MTWIEQADAFELLPKLSTDSYDLVLTDPPYDLSEAQKHRLLDELTRVSKGAVILFAPIDNQYPNNATWKCEIYYVWIKPTSTKNTTKRPSNFAEIIQVYGKYKWNTGRHWSQYTNVFTDLVDTTEHHAFRKPPSLIERLLLNHSDVKDHILDPFAGSGIIGTTCARYARQCSSFDIIGTI